MSPTGDLLVTPIFLWGDAALSLLRLSHVLHWHGTKPGAAHPSLGNIILPARRGQGSLRCRCASAQELAVHPCPNPTDPALPPFCCRLLACQLCDRRLWEWATSSTLDSVLILMPTPRSSILRSDALGKGATSSTLVALQPRQRLRAFDLSIDPHAHPTCLRSAIGGFGCGLLLLRLQRASSVARSI